MGHTLVIGYGNPLRRDDGAGPALARRIADLRLPGVEVIEAHQLLPEHAAALSRADRALFVDASAEPGLAAPRMRELQPSAEPSLAPHASDPEALLALAAILFEHSPEARLLEIPAADLSIGEGLSTATLEACDQALERARAWLA
jgi:hydrogenase maturation protease